MATIILDAGNRVQATALFNKLTGEFVTVTSNPIEEGGFDEKFFIGRGISFNFTANGDVVEGNIIINEDGTTTDNFKVVAQEDATPVITEEQLNQMAATKITKKYPVASQINVLSKAVLRLGEEHDLLEAEEFQDLLEMIDYIQYCQSVNATKKEYYQNDPDTTYVSNEEADAQLNRRMEGGVHEALGSRPVQGGRVFG